MNEIWNLAIFFVTKITCIEVTEAKGEDPIKLNTWDEDPVKAIDLFWKLIANHIIDLNLHKDANHPLDIQLITAGKALHTSLRLLPQYLGVWFEFRKQFPPNTYGVLPRGHKITHDQAIAHERAMAVMRDCENILVILSWFKRNNQIPFKV